MPELGYLKRENWRTVRDAANVAEGYTKASIGDLLDTYCDVTGQRKSFGAGLSKALTKIDKAGGRERVIQATIAFYAAVMEYCAKLEKDGKLGGVNKAAFVPARGNHMEALWVRLRNFRKACVATMQKLQAESNLVKAVPAARADVDEFRHATGEALPTRKAWQNTRDGAGLPKGYIQASIGDLNEALTNLLGADHVQRGLAHALEHIEDGQQAAVGQAAARLCTAAVQYYKKLAADGKLAKPHVADVVRLLDLMRETSLEVCMDTNTALGPLADAFHAANLDNAELTRVWH